MDYINQTIEKTIIELFCSKFKDKIDQGEKF